MNVEKMKNYIEKIDKQNAQKNVICINRINYIIRLYLTNMNFDCKNYNVKYVKRIIDDFFNKTSMLYNDYYDDDISNE